jgi:uncharacterized protein (TIGR00255 family)
MIKSMTAYARNEKVSGTFAVAVEIRSYNSRHLDIVCRMPNAYLQLEDKIKKFIAAKIFRGRIETAIQIKDESDNVPVYEVNEALAKAYYDALGQLKAAVKSQDEIPLSLLASAGGIIKPAELERDMDTCWQVLEECLFETIKDHEAMRLKEGRFISDDFDKRLADIETCVDQIEKQTENLTQLYKQKLEGRIKELTDGVIAIDQDRIAQEAAILADRSDISEEIVRSRSHIQQFRDLLAAEEPAGRKLNFLLQEFNREFNTLGAKSAHANITPLVVDLKSELEKIREQVQNIE